MEVEETKIIATSTVDILKHHHGATGVANQELSDPTPAPWTMVQPNSINTAVDAMPTEIEQRRSDTTVPAVQEPEKAVLKVANDHVFDTASSLDLEKQEEQHVPRPGWYSFLRYTALNTYRRLFTLVFIANVVAFITVMARGAPLLDLVNAASINLCVCGLVRSPIVINNLYLIACKVPKSAPITIRTLAAKIFHFGGVHSGCGVASAVWYIAFVGVLTHSYVHHTIPNTGPYVAVTVLAYVIMILLVAIIIAALPAIRSKWHDYFEAIHRFSGWAVILVFWALLLTFASQQLPAMGIFLINQPSFWIIIILTAAVVHPWAMLRKVKVTPEVLSTHATRLHFDHQYTKFGQGLSIARHPLKDWHSFASFPDSLDRSDHKFSLVVSKAGDFTGDLINNPPEYIWKRAIPVRGFGYVMKLYRRMILVTTGSGIGPCLSYLACEDRPDMRIVWQTRNPKKTYGQGVIDLVHRMDNNPCILDTSAGGRVDMLPYVMKLYKDFDAEAVCIISNPMMTKKLVFELSRRGIIAMGPIFDS